MPPLFFYNYNGTIQYGPIDSAEGIFAALHEQGHKACDHKDPGPGHIGLSDVDRECEAWAYARRCVRAEYHQSFDVYALRCINTYNAQAEMTWGEWYIDNTILAKIRVEA